MRTKNKDITRRVLAGAIALAFVLPACLIMVQGTANADCGGRALTAGELESAFGDGNCYCYETWTCEKRQTSGTSNCYYCDASNITYSPCCQSDTMDDTCKETHDTCDGEDRYYGPKSGSTKYCGTCDIDGTPTQSGECGARSTIYADDVDKNTACD